MAYKSNYKFKNRTRENQKAKPKKRSGCHEFIDDNGKKWLRGWNLSKSRGMVGFIACEKMTNKKNASQGLAPSVCVSKKTGEIKDTVLMSVKVNFQRECREVWTIGFYNPKTQKMTIPSMGMVANPNAIRGGYWGTYVDSSSNES